MATAQTITVSAEINVPVGRAWAFWTDPAHITQWNQASEDWHTPRAVNDVQPGGAFNWRMESKDGTMGFDFAGTYDEVVPQRSLRYTIADGRKVTVEFASAGEHTTITETFEAESEHSTALQQQGWQAVLNNFKAHAEAQP